MTEPETKIDKRKQTSKDNMAKARAAKIAKQKEQKQIQEIEIDSGSEYSDSEDYSDESEDEELVIRNLRLRKERLPNRKERKVKIEMTE
jgi:hypothetical protein